MAGAPEPHEWESLRSELTDLRDYARNLERALHFSQRDSPIPMVPTTSVLVTSATFQIVAHCSLGFTGNDVFYMSFDINLQQGIPAVWGNVQFRVRNLTNPEFGVTTSPEWTVDSVAPRRITLAWLHPFSVGVDDQRHMPGADLPRISPTFQSLFVEARRVNGNYDMRCNMPPIHATWSNITAVTTATAAGTWSIA